MQRSDVHHELTNVFRDVMRLNETFQGYQQQDAEELLLCILGTLFLIVEFKKNSLLCFKNISLESFIRVWRVMLLGRMVSLLRSKALVLVL